MRHRSDSGYTLVELLISISMISVLMLGITNAFVTSNRAQTHMEEELGSKNDLLNVSSYFTQDVQSATSSLSPGTTGCGGETVDVGFRWTDAANADVYTVGYKRTGTRLVRTVCRKPTTGPEEQLQRNNLGRQIASVSSDPIPTPPSGPTVGRTLTVTTTAGTSVVYRAYCRIRPC